MAGQNKFAERIPPVWRDFSANLFCGKHKIIQRPNKQFVINYQKKQETNKIKRENSSKADKGMQGGLYKLSKS